MVYKDCIKINQHMINVYIEHGGHAECVATIADEWTYMELLPAFEQLAINNHGILTESVVDPPPPIPTSVFMVYSEDEYSTDMDKYIMYSVHFTREKAEAKMRELIAENNADLKFFISEESVS